MFGYIRTDTPYLYIKDEMLYKAMYCGVCKGIGESCGQCARMGLTYDVTFFSIILHNIAGIDIVVKKQHCLTHTIRTRKMACVDEMMKKLGAINTALVYYKYTDDIMDGDRGRGKRLWFNGGHKKGMTAYPEIERIIRENMAAQEKVEKSETESIDMAADSSSEMLAQLSDYILEDKKTQYTHNLFYAIGKWIYLIDAVDDYDKDLKKGAYNPFVLSYKSKDKKTLIEDNKEDIAYIFDSLFYSIRQNLSNIKFYFNRDLSDNILLRGIPSVTMHVLSCPEYNKCKKCKKECKNQKSPQENKNQDEDVK